jgi:hypothetical protein
MPSSILRIFIDGKSRVLTSIVPGNASRYNQTRHLWEVLQSFNDFLGAPNKGTWARTVIKISDDCSSNGYAYTVLRMFEQHSGAHVSLVASGFSAAD